VSFVILDLWNDMAEDYEVIPTTMT